MGGSDAPALSDSDAKLVEDLLAGSHRALARVITRIENRAAGYRGIVAALHEHTGGADVIGITGAPGAGKSTLVDKLAAAYRDRGDTVGVVAVDPPRRTPAERYSATGSEWRRTSATWTCSSGR